MWINQKRTDFWAPCFHLHILQEHQGYYTLLSGPTKKNTKLNPFRSNEEDKIMEKRLLTIVVKKVTSDASQTEGRI